MKINLPFHDIKFKKALSVIRILRKSGFEAYLVGGCVRDILMRVQPEEYDISTSARPPEILGLFNKAVRVGEQFGVVRVIHGGSEFEVATFRGEEGYSDGRHPDRIIFTSAKEDVLRRDFTVNGLMFNPENGEVMDFVEGLKDIRERVIRTIGNPEERFNEDKLRILRAVRFAAQLDFEIEIKTWAAVKSRASEITCVSMERVRDEIVKILTTDNIVKGLRLLVEAGLAERIFSSQTCATLLCEERLSLFQSLRRSGDKHRDKIIALALFFQGGSQAEIEEEMSRLKFSKKEIEGVLSLTSGLEQALLYERMELANKRVMLASRDPVMLLDYLETHSRNCEMNMKTFEHWKEIFKRYGSSLIPERLINGEDLKKMGVSPSPLMGKILKEVERAQLNEEIGTREEALKLAKEIWKKTICPDTGKRDVKGSPSDRL